MIRNLLTKQSKVDSRTREENEAGFTLMEVLVALVILGIGFSILIQGYSLIIDSLEKQRDYNYLVSWAEGKLIEVSNGLELTPRGYFTHNGKEFKWSIEHNVKGDGLREIVLNVEWPGPNGLRSYRVGRIVYSPE